MINLTKLNIIFYIHLRDNILKTKLKYFTLKLFTLFIQPRYAFRIKDPYYIRAILPIIV